MEKQLTIVPQQIKTCAFTGHRELGYDFSAKAFEKEIAELIERGAEIFYNGMARGFDLFAAETVVKLKKKYPQIKLVACVPCLEQEKGFSERDKTRYKKILSKADKKVVLSEYYYSGCMLARNRYMADRADVLVAYCKKQTGGTAYTVEYFRKKYPSREIIFL